MKRFSRIATSSIVVLALLSVLRGQAQQTQPTESELVKSTVDSVVLIVISDENGKPVAEGSGFIVSSDGKIVTNQHVVGGAHSAIVSSITDHFYGSMASSLTIPITTSLSSKWQGKTSRRWL